MSGSGNCLESQESSFLWWYQLIFHYFFQPMTNIYLLGCLTSVRLQVCTLCTMPFKFLWQISWVLFCHWLATCAFVSSRLILFRLILLQMKVKCGCGNLSRVVICCENEREYRRIRTSQLAAQMFRDENNYSNNNTSISTSATISNDFSGNIGVTSLTMIREYS